MVKNAFICWPQLYTQPIGRHIRKLCDMFNMEVEFHNLKSIRSRKEYIECLSRFDNTICWVYNFCPRIMYVNACKNVLFVEPGPIDTLNTYYFDSIGIRGSSSLVLNEINKQKINESQRIELYKTLDELDFGLPKEENKKEYILIFSHLDENMLEYCSDYLPKDVDVLVRPHYANYKETYDLCNKFCEINNNWKIDKEIYAWKSIKDAKACVSIDNVFINKSLSMRIPVATLYKGLFSGSGATLECWDDPSNLFFLLDFEFNIESTENYLYSLISNVINKNVSFEQIKNNQHVHKWIRRAGYK